MESERNGSRSADAAASGEYDEEQKPIPVSSRGFRAELSDVTLADLVQMKCLGGQREAVLIRSGTERGVLVFGEGSILHAQAGQLEGDHAVLRMLSWQTGSIRPGSAPAGTPRTVTQSWQSLLMHAAQASDEQQRESSPFIDEAEIIDDDDGTTTLPGIALPDGVVALDDRAAEVRAHHPSRSVSAEEEQEMSSLDQLGLEPAVRIDVHGNVLESRGDTEELAPILALATRLANLAGDDLGLESLSALEARVGRRTCLAYQDSDGTYVGFLTDPSIDINEIRRQLNL